MDCRKGHCRLANNGYFPPHLFHVISIKKFFKKREREKKVEKKIKECCLHMATPILPTTFELKGSNSWKEMSDEWTNKLILC